MVEKRALISQQGSDAASDVLGMKFGIKRYGSTVQISLRCDGDYQAMELYDRLVEAAQKGKVTIDLKAK